MEKILFFLSFCVPSSLVIFSFLKQNWAVKSTIDLNMKWGEKQEKDNTKAHECGFLKRANFSSFLKTQVILGEGAGRWLSVTGPSPVIWVVSLEPKWQKGNQLLNIVFWTPYALWHTILLLPWAYKCSSYTQRPAFLIFFPILVSSKESVNFLFHLDCQKRSLLKSWPQWFCFYFPSLHIYLLMCFLSGLSPMPPIFSALSPSKPTQSCSLFRNY